MVRTIFVPRNKRMTLPIPDSYIGTRLEMIIFPAEENTISVDTSEVREQGERKPVFGCAKGQFIMSDDFDAPLDDFMEYH
jgi:hypothetical protein